jgi:hypothetical protein
MAVETIALEFQFQFIDERPSWDDIQNLTFRYNALHDIESAWWLGVWMMYFFRPEGHEESSDTSKRRQNETIDVFPGTLSYYRRLLYLERPKYFLFHTLVWIAAESNRAIEILDGVRIWLLKLYQDLEKTFPDGLPMLSSPVNPASGAAFPGGPVSDIYQPIKDLFLAAKDAYKDTELVPFKRAYESPQMYTKLRETEDSEEQ